MKQSKSLHSIMLLCLLFCSVCTSCYTTRWYSYSLESQYNTTYRGDSKEQIVNSFGIPSRISSIGDGVEILVYENFNSMTIGNGNATAYGYGNSVNAYGNNYSYTFNGRNFVEFYIKDGKCYQVRTNAKKWEKKRVKVSFWDW